MRRSANKDSHYVQWSIRLNKSDKDNYRALLPITGSLAWVVETSLRYFLNTIEPNEALEYETHRLIKRHLDNYGNIKGDVEPIDARVPAELDSRFNAIFPEKGSQSWFIRSVITALLPELTDMRLEERVESAVRTVIKGGIL